MSEQQRGDILLYLGSCLNLEAKVCGSRPFWEGFFNDTQRDGTSGASQLEDLIFSVLQFLGEFGDGYGHGHKRHLLLHSGRRDDTLRPGERPPL